MIKGLYTAYTGMAEEQRRLDVLSNNLANADTVGYKKEGTVNRAFYDRLAIRIKDSGDNVGAWKIGKMSMGDKIGETYTNYDQGNFQVTDQPSDLAISGKGFFAIAHTDGNGNKTIKYTRDGNFVVDRNGYMRTADGDYVLNQFGAANSNGNAGNYVRIDPMQEYTVGYNGIVYQNDQAVSQVGMVDFANYDYLSKYGDNLYDIVDGAQMVGTDATIEQGTLEASNVNVVDEMVDMMTIQRAYEAGQKFIQTADTTLDAAANTVGRV
jgi:flagellar basal-body rod protein FlgF